MFSARFARRIHTFTHPFNHFDVQSGSITFILIVLTGATSEANERTSNTFFIVNVNLAMCTPSFKTIESVGIRPGAPRFIVAIIGDMIFAIKTDSKQPVGRVEAFNKQAEARRFRRMQIRPDAGIRVG